jgi:hypothetical protein
MPQHARSAASSSWAMLQMQMQWQIDLHEQAPVGRAVASVLLQHAPKLRGRGTVQRVVWPSRRGPEARSHMTAALVRPCCLWRPSLLRSLLFRLIGLVTVSPSLGSLASSNVGLSMLQDYTVYTHLPEPLETPLLPGRRMLAALPVLAALLIGKQSRGGVPSMWSRFPRLLESVPCRTRGHARSPTGNRSRERVWRRLS